MKAHKIREEAAQEIAEAASWYEQEAAPGLGADLRPCARTKLSLHRSRRT